MSIVQNIDKILSYLIGEFPAHKKLVIPSDLVAKRQLMRSLMNIRQPVPMPEELILNCSKSFTKKE